MPQARNSAWIVPQMMVGAFYWATSTYARVTGSSAVKPQFFDQSAVIGRGVAVNRRLFALAAQNLQLRRRIARPLRAFSLRTNSTKRSRTMAENSEAISTLNTLIATT